MTDFTLNNDKLTFIPLGGCGRFEGNLNAYCYGGKILLIDMGIGFADDYHPGVDIILPDPQWLEDRKDQIVGLIISHAHEDHLGSIGYLWDRVQCPIYTTLFTAQVVKRKLSDHGLLKTASIHQVDMGSDLTVGPFDLRLVPATHSTPEPFMVHIKLPNAQVIHTADWRFDEKPLMTEKTDKTYLQFLGEQGGIDALIGDSTNAVKQGQAPSYSDLFQSFETVLQQSPNALVFACQGLSALSRIQVLTEIAEQYDRKIALAGGAILRAYEIAVDMGMMKRNSIIIDAKEMMQMPRAKRIFVCTGSQAERFAALTRIAYENHHIVKLTAGDTVVFSARIIPGREKGIADMKRALSINGIEIITNSEIPNVYVSGHAHADEIRQLLDWAKPKAVLPIHGDFDHQVAQADIAKAQGIEMSLIPRNGDVIEIDQGSVTRIGQVLTGYLAVDGKRIIAAHDSRSMRERRKSGQNGVGLITLVLNNLGKFKEEPVISLIGLTEDDEAGKSLTIALTKEIKRYLSKLKEDQIHDDAQVREETRLAAMRYIRDHFNKKPVLTIHLIRV